ncbi:hypothetical protein SAMN05421578_1197 [Paenibacillus macquariensis]|uniref:Uncharacterized protein n=1 Tax=Paenibacillus macquariensis TaxID=948756 RepID=A0ABY1KBQ8_9BACL|nr:hypothetical protein SAMN05421578_1197 [Paenibacillus macquariensis]
MDAVSTVMAGNYARIDNGMLSPLPKTSWFSLKSSINSLSLVIKKPPSIGELTRIKESNFLHSIVAGVRGTSPMLMPQPLMYQGFMSD